MKGYVWEDSNDPYATGAPDLGYVLASKRAALKDFRSYVDEGGFRWSPKIRLWKVTAEEVKA